MWTRPKFTSLALQENITKARKTVNYEQNDIRYELFYQVRSYNITLIGKLMQEQIIIYNAELGLGYFTVSNGWLQAV